MEKGKFVIQPNKEKLWRAVYQEKKGIDLSEMKQDIDRAVAIYGLMQNGRTAVGYYESLEIFLQKTKNVIFEYQTALEGKEKSGISCFHQEKERLPVMVMAATLGRDIEAEIGKLFQDGEYTVGYLLNLCSDICLMEEMSRLEEELIRSLDTKGFGILEKTEPPQMLSIESWRECLQRLKRDGDMCITMTESGMMMPEKSLCQIYFLGSCCQTGYQGHACTNCTRKECQYRGIGLQ